MTDHACPEQRCPDPSTTCYTHGCRCQGCRDQRAARERRRVRRNLEESYGARRPKWTDPQPVRQHVRSLMASGPSQTDGAGWKTIAHTAGVATSTVCQLLYGKRGQPITRMLTANADALLAVGRDDTIRGGQTVDATRTRNAIGYLTSHGWTRAAIGAWVTGNPDCRQLQLADDMVLASSEAAVLDLLRAWNRSQVETNQRPDRQDQP